MRDKIIFLLLFITILGFAVGLRLILPGATYLYDSTMTYNTKVAEMATNYPNITTPLSQETIYDICKKFEVDLSDARCQPNSVVYGPDFFADIKGYLDNIPEKDATFELVESKLGAYLINCEEPAKDGSYRCHYDIRGDGYYPIIVWFSEKNIYYWVIATTAGS